MMWMRDLDEDNISSIFLCIFIVIIIFICGVSFTENERNKISQGTVVSKSMSSPNPNPCIKPSFTITIEGEKNGKIVEYSFFVPEREHVKYNIGE